MLQGLIIVNIYSEECITLWKLCHHNYTKQLHLTNSIA